MHRSNESVESETIRIAIGVPLQPRLVAEIAACGPQVRVDWVPEALPPMRDPGDFVGGVDHVRSDAAARRFDRALREADVILGVPDNDPAYLKDIVESNRALRWVHTMAAGGGQQIRAAALSAPSLRRVAFTSSAGVHAQPLAEFALFGLLAAAKRIDRLEDAKRRHEWPARWIMRQVGDLTVLILGLGGIGERLAEMLTALGAHVIGVNRNGGGPDKVAELLTLDRIEEVLHRVDAVVNVLPHTESTVGLIGSDFLRRLRPGATLVSIGRGTVVDESAVIDALDAGALGFAVLDVFESEPLASDSPLWDRDDIIISPHTAALTDGEADRIVRLFIRNLERLACRRPLLNLIDTSEFY